MVGYFVWTKKLKFVIDGVPFTRTFLFLPRSLLLVVAALVFPNEHNCSILTLCSGISSAMAGRRLQRKAIGLE